MLKGGELTLPISTLKNIFSPYFAQEQFSAPVGSAYAVVLPEVVGESLTPPVSPYYEAIPPAPPEWWDPNWTKRRAITISGYHPTDYQLKVVLPFYDASIRFLEDATSGLLPYWVESYTANSMTVWVKRSIANDGDDHTIYVYYGNPNAGSASDGNATFMFFDDFSGDLSKWVTNLPGTSGNVSIVNGRMRIQGNTSNQMGVARSATFQVSDGIIEGVFQIAQRDYFCRFRMADLNNCYMVMCSKITNTHVIFKVVGGTWTTLASTNYSPGTAVHKFKVSFSGSSLKAWVDDTAYISATDTAYTSGYIALTSGGNTTGVGDVYYDNVRVRKYTDPEPTTSVGEEEQYGG
jgi:hypothetical protein